MTLLAPHRPQARTRVISGAGTDGREEQPGSDRGRPPAALRAAAPLLGAVALSLACAAPEPTPPRPTPPAPPDRSRPPPPAPTPEPCARIVRLEVDKSERTLRALCESGREVSMRAALGREPEGAKRTAGDHRTPEGRYRLLDAEESRFHVFLPFDYPSVEDARRAHREGLLSTRDRRRIEEAHASGMPPPADTPLGGDLGLHGEGADWAGASELLDWTYGCVALSDEDIDFVVERTGPGTPIDIHP